MKRTPMRVYLMHALLINRTNEIGPNPYGRPVLFMYALETPGIGSGGGCVESEERESEVCAERSGELGEWVEEEVVREVECSGEKDGLDVESKGHRGCVERGRESIR